MEASAPERLHMESPWALQGACFQGHVVTLACSSLHASERHREKGGGLLVGSNNRFGSGSDQSGAATLRDRLRAPARATGRCYVWKRRAYGRNPEGSGPTLTL